MKLTPTTINETRDLKHGDSPYHYVHFDVSGVDGAARALACVGRTFAADIAVLFAGDLNLPADDPRSIEHAATILTAAREVVAAHYKAVA